MHLQIPSGMGSSITAGDSWLCITISKPPRNILFISSALLFTMTLAIRSADTFSSSSRRTKSV